MKEKRNKKIGIFDSGVGGLLIAKAIQKFMPEYDYVYLGDTKRVPYGGRSHESVYQFVCEALDYLFLKENCGLVVLACNTASARALRRIQEQYLLNTEALPSYARVLGVLIPAGEEVENFSRVGVLATKGTVASKTFSNEIKKINKKIKVFEESAPMLVPLAEEGEKKLAEVFLKKYLKPLIAKKVEVIVLGCTHYPIYKKEIKKIAGKNIKLVSQDEIIPQKLKKYLEKHREIEKHLLKNSKTKILVTDMTDNIIKLSQKWFGKNVKPLLVKIDKS